MKKITKRFSNGTKVLPPVEELRELFSYDPETGVVRYKKAPKSSKIKAGEKAGCLEKKSKAVNAKEYLTVKINQISYKLHRVIFKLMTGKDPGLKEIDHKDGNGLNNAWSNLRLATSGQNNANKQSTCKAGLKGVGKEPSGNYRAFIGRTGKRINLGTFKTAEAAHAAYCKAAEEFFGEFKNTAHKLTS